MLQSLSEVKIVREKLRQFMLGRYGTDDLGRFTWYFVLIGYLLNIFLGSSVLRLVVLVAAILGIYRVMSRNHQKRYQENIKFLNLKNKITHRFRQEKSNMKQRKTHHIYRCPSCGQKIRIPKGKGRICITCPKCKTEFTKVS